jgi:hypothetical protein
MSQNQTNEEIIYRIVSGEQIIEVAGEIYKVKMPDNKLRLEAENLFKDTIRKNRFNDFWLTDRQCLGLLVKNGLCTADVDSNLKTIEKSIEDLKISLYNSMFSSDMFADKKKQLSMVKKKHAEMIFNRHCFDHLTLKGYASMIKSQFLIFNTLYSEDDKRIWKKFDEVEVFLLEKISNRILENTISPSKIREIARTEPWRGYWNIKKTNIFDGPVFNFTDEQKSLVLYSKMYDSAFEHPESPTEEVIKDDDLFDGWMLTQHRKAEKDKMTAQLDKHLNKGSKKMANADEMFLVAKTPEERQRIEAMNDVSGAIIKAQRRAAIKKQGGKATDSSFPDRRIAMTQQSNQQFMKKVKGK